MKLETFGWLRKMIAGRSTRAARVSVSPVAELLMQTDRLHVAR